MYFFEFENRKLCLDATKETDRKGRLLNHSRTNSNVYPRVHTIDGYPHIVFYAKDIIRPQQELVYDYGDRSKKSIDDNRWLTV